MPMYELPLIYVFGVFWGWGFRVGASIFCSGVFGNGILSLAFCPEISCYNSLFVGKEVLESYL